MLAARKTSPARSWPSEYNRSYEGDAAKDGGSAWRCGRVAPLALPSNVKFRFARYEIDAGRRELLRDGATVVVQPKVLDVLIHLIRHRERVVSKHELLDELWGDAAVSEGVLSTAIHAARSAIEDTASRAWAIKTVARHGYRFVAEVSEPADPVGEPRSQDSKVRVPDSGPEDLFVGRDRIFRRISAAFQAAAGGRGRVITISGESGIGKTRILDELMIRAEQWNARVLAAWCDARDGAPPYAPWADMLEGILADEEPTQAAAELGAGAADLASLIPSIRRLRPDIEEPPRLFSGTSRFRLFESIRSFLACHSSRQPIVMLIDDVQSADHASLRLLAHLAREVRHLRILIVVTLREHAGTPDRVVEETLAELARQFPGERMVLEGLSPEEIATLVSHLSDAAPASGLVETIQLRSEGNPFFVKEIVSLVDLDPETGSDPAQGTSGTNWATCVPPGVRDVILGRLHRCSDSCQQALSGASVLGREFRMAMLARLIDRDPVGLAEAIAEGCATGFLREDPANADLFRFSHGLLHETIYDSATSAQRKRLHRRAGEALESRRDIPSETSPAEVALHFLRAGDDEALGKSIEYASRAARYATSVHAHDEASKLYGMALDALERMSAPDEAMRCELLISLGAAQLGARVGDPRGRESLLRAAEIARQLGEPLQLARAVLEVSAMTMQNVPGDPEITRLLEAALQATGPAHDALRARLAASLAFQLRSHADHDRSLALCEEAVALARKAGDTLALCEALNMRCTLHSGPGFSTARLRDADELLTLAVEANSSELGLFGYRWRLLTMFEVGDMEAVDRELAAYDAAAERGRIWSARWYGLTMRAARAFSEARFEASERMIVESFAHRRDATTPLIIGVFATQLFWLRRFQGRLDEVAHLRNNPSPQPMFRVLRTLLDAELGNLEPARSALREMVERDLELAPRDFTYLYTLSALAEICVAVEGRDEARVIYEKLLPHADRYVLLFMGSMQLGSASRALGCLASLLGDAEAADRHFAAALEANQRIGAHLWIACTRLDWANQLASTGDAGARRARELLRPCLADAHERGIASLARRASELMDRLPS